MADVKNTTEGRENLSQPGARMRRREGNRDKSSSTGDQAHSFKQDQLSHPSLRRLQAKLEAENQQAQKLIQPLLDTENGFMKELECFLSQQDVAELRKRELIHRDWTKRVWLPLQKRVEERVSSCSHVKVKRWQSLCSVNLHHNSKVETAEFKDTLDFNQCKSLKEKKMPPSWQTRDKCTWQKLRTHSQSHGVSDKCAPTQASRFPQALSHHPASTSIEIPKKNETAQKKSERFNAIPSHIDGRSDGMFHKCSCWFSTWESFLQSKIHSN